MRPRLKPEDGAVISYSHGDFKISGWGSGAAMIIRDGQMNKMRDSMDPQFARELAQHARTFHSEAVARYSDTALYRLAMSGIRQARTFGLARAGDIAAFVALRFQISLNFYLQPAVHSVLAARDIAPEEKMKRLKQDISEAEWEEARKF